MIAGGSAPPLRRADFDFSLPEDLIAQAPPEARSAGRLLWLRADGARADRRVGDLPDCLGAGDLMVFNDTRVIPARLFARKATGGRVELLVERLPGGDVALVQARSSKPLREGAELRVEGADARLVVDGREGDFFRLRRSRGPAWSELLEVAGHVPLPPYIRREDAPEDRSRYQTVFARTPGAVAAPTAGLHFDDELLRSLDARGVARAMLTLHVGAGTFQPVREEDLSRHRMHPEAYTVGEGLVEDIARTRAAGRRVVAVGTTVARALEAAAADGKLRAGAGETRLFITPGHRFRTVDLLFTNFHLPQSTLLMLVCAFGGQARVLSAYAHAVREQYRFFSYGDAMLVEPDADAARA